MGDRAAAGAAEVAVEVGAYLVALQPRRAQVLQRQLDVVIGEVVDVGGADGVVRRAVQALLRFRQQIQPGEEEGHRGIVIAGQLAEPGEEAVAHLGRAVPGEDHELGRLLAGLQPLRLGRLVGLLAGVRGRAVADRLALRRLSVLASDLAGGRRTGGRTARYGQSRRRSHPESEHSSPTVITHNGAHRISFEVLVWGPPEKWTPRREGGGGGCRFPLRPREGGFSVECCGRPGPPHFCLRSRPGASVVVRRQLLHVGAPPCDGRGRRLKASAARNQRPWMHMTLTEIASAPVTPH
ncbi:hypothetical protein BG653_06358 [Streptomyces platensis]|uniref:Uncharacterized protein n=1 Tax=Streptomyces platensis TaxID=58346 RepID=A0ABX3XMY0_STRPT|nr:hypothetical protein BG653_06358 [Streptomyces platensis]